MSSPLFSIHMIQAEMLSLGRNMNPLYTFEMDAIIFELTCFQKKSPEHPMAHLFNTINGIFHLTCRYPVYGKILIKVVNGDHASKSHQEVKIAHKYLVSSRFYILGAISLLRHQNI